MIKLDSTHFLLRFNSVTIDANWSSCRFSFYQEWSNPASEWLYRALRGRHSELPPWSCQSPCMHPEVGESRNNLRGYGTFEPTVSIECAARSTSRRACSTSIFLNWFNYLYCFVTSILDFAISFLIESNFSSFWPKAVRDLTWMNIADYSSY